MRVIAFDVVSSTMSKAYEMCAEIPESAFCIFAHEQQEGQGTFGRKWHSPRGNFYATYCIKNIDFEQASISTIALVSGIATAETLCEYNIRIHLKWSNDLMMNNHKVGGILCVLKNNALFIGIGINFKHVPDMTGLSTKFPPMAIDPECNIDYLDFAKKLGIHIMRNLDLFCTQGFDEFVPLWKNYAAFSDHRVIIKQPDGTMITGIDKGINVQGHLLIEHQGVISNFHSARIVDLG